MFDVFPETPPQAERLLLEKLRAVPAWRKLDLVAQLNQTARQLAIIGLRRRLADLILGPDLATRAYGPLIEPEATDAA
jgi:hypothetical protein